MRRALGTPRPLRVLALLLALAALAWTRPGGGYTLALAPAWAERSGNADIPGAQGRWVHTPTGGGLVVRDLDRDGLLDVRGRAQHLDLEGALSPDRVARVAQQSQDAEEVGLTVTVGPGDGPDSGRWVYLPPAQEGEPARVWWQVFWRSPAGYHQAIGWAPLTQGAAFIQAMRQVERSVSPQPGWSPPRVVLFDAGRDDCGPPLRVDPAAALRASRRPAEAQAALRAAYAARQSRGEGPMDLATGLALADLRAVGLLHRMTEECTLRLARERRECLVEQGAPDGARSQGFQAALTACLDADTTLTETLRTALTPFLGPL